MFVYTGQLGLYEQKALTSFFMQGSCTCQLLNPSSDTDLELRV